MVLLWIYYYGNDINDDELWVNVLDGYGIILNDYYVCDIDGIELINDNVDGIILINYNGFDGVLYYLL